MGCELWLHISKCANHGVGTELCCMYSMEKVMPSFQRFECKCTSVVIPSRLGRSSDPQPARAAMYSPTLGYLEIVHLTLCLIPPCDPHPQPSKWTLQCT